MADKTYKLIEVVGISGKSFADATSKAITKAAKSLHGIRWFEVTELRGAVENGKVSQYQAKVKIAFELD